MSFDEGSVDSICEREFSEILSGIVFIFVHLERILHGPLGLNTFELG
jgi:hypothetical protein